MSDRFQRAMLAIDATNTDEACDPDRKELLYGQRMSERLARFEPDAGEVLALAVRAQHLCRWRLVRADYPAGRAGYKAWRSELAQMHAELAGQILADSGYEADAVTRVGELLQKKRLADDAEVQVLEDVACLVFLEHYLVDFADKYTAEDDTKLGKILAKTWRKMSARAQAAAGQLELPDRLASIVRRATA